MCVFCPQLISRTSIWQRLSKHFDGFFPPQNNKPGSDNSTPRPVIRCLKYDLQEETFINRIVNKTITNLSKRKQAQESLATAMSLFKFSSFIQFDWNYTLKLSFLELLIAKKQSSKTMLNYYYYMSNLIGFYEDWDEGLGWWYGIGDRNWNLELEFGDWNGGWRLIMEISIQEYEWDMRISVVAKCQ